MNYEVGGTRVLTTLLVGVWLLCGGVAAAMCFGSLPANLPYDTETWIGMQVGVGVGAIGAGHGFRAMVAEHRKQNDGQAPGAGTFFMSLWGFGAVIVGWLASLGFVLATAGGWQPPLKGFIYSGMISACIDTIVCIGLVWGIPLVVVFFFVWLVEGFRAKT